MNGLNAGYGRSQVLFDVGLKVPRAGAVAVLGRNGVGKTTLLKAIIGELPAMQGHVAFDGQDVTRLPTERRVRLGLGYVPQEFSTFARLTVRENLAVGNLTRQDSAAVDEVLGMFPKLGQRLDQVAGTLSGGERKMLAIARALLLKPRVLLLDEPTAGMSLEERRVTGEFLRPLTARCAIVIVEHDLDFIRDLCDVLTVLDQGKVLESGSVAQIQASERVQEVYLTRV